MPDAHTPDDGLAAFDLGTAELLHRRRPVPAPGFRGVLGRHLMALDPGWGPRPARLRLIVAAYLLVALILIGLAALIGIGGL